MYPFCFEVKNEIALSALLVSPGSDFVDAFLFPPCHDGPAARIEILNSLCVVQNFNILCDFVPEFVALLGLVTAMRKDVLSASLLQMKVAHQR